LKKNVFWGSIAILLLISSVIQILLDCNIANGKKITQVAKGSSYYIFVEIEDNTLYLMQDGKCIKKYPVSSGRSSLPSPVGYWKIVEKGDWGEGFGGRWMGIIVPWGKYGIHGTTEEDAIGSAASHGCIRMFNSDVKELYNIVGIGTPVTIVNGSFGPFGAGYKSIEPGDRGADVLAIQVRLKDLGFFKGWCSGIYEDNLKVAVHNFQKKNGLKVQNTITKKDWLGMGFREFE
jgi:hypothetical protein